MAGEGLKDTELLDLIIATQPHLPKAQLGTPQNYTDLPIVNRVLTMGWIISGRDPEVRVKVKQSTKARMERLYQSREYNKVDLLKKATSRWGHLTTDWLIDRREDLINKGAEEIVNVLKVNKLDAVMDMAELMERLSWMTEKADSDSDLSLKGVPYWIANNATRTGAAGTVGFTGDATVDRDGTAITQPGGISPTTYPLTANYFDVYTNPGSESGTGIGDSMVEAMIKLFHSCNFKSPRIVQDLENNNPLANFRIYTTLRNILYYEKWVKNHNQDIGFDAAKYLGKTPFNGIPLERDPLLEEVALIDAETATSKKIYGIHPFYFVNWNVLIPFALKGNNLYEHDPMILPNQPNTVVVVLDHSMNYLAKNRRMLGKLIQKE